MRRLRRSHSGIELLGILAAILTAIFAGATTYAADDHSQHRKSMQSSTVKVETASYAIPDVTLTNEDGIKVRLQDVMSGDQPLAVNFIFTSCTTICPVMTATMLQLQGQLANDASQPMYVSISIDPDFDSAVVMKSYAANYGADWTFLTGSQQDVMTVLQTFDAYRGSKINHFALTLFRTGDDTEWTRVEGLTSARELAEIWRQIGS